MKHILTLGFFVFLLCGCVQHKLSNKAIAQKYFEARNTLNYKEVSKYVGDSLTVIEGDYVMPYSVSSYYEVFKWDSVFQTTYEIKDIQENGDHVVASIALKSIRNEFLKNELMTCQFRLSFNSAKISKVESFDCEDADWKVWQKRVGDLVEWIKINHPELDGFVYDMTMNGAQNYLKAIQLYKSNNGEL